MPDRKTGQPAARRNQIPVRYEHCTLDNFESAFSGATRSVAGAHLKARDFVERYQSIRGVSGCC